MADLSGGLFQMGVARPWRLQSRSRRLSVTDGSAPFIFDPETWEERQQQPPAPGHIRLLSDPPQDNIHLETWWYRDRTLTQWIHDMDYVAANLSAQPILRAIYPPNYEGSVRDLFYANQRRRWLARWTLARWRQRVWSRRPACNVDLIDMAPIPPSQAITITDPKNRTVYRFHRNDILKNFMSNICMSDEFMVCPRPPTNPWTNEPLTLSQTIAVCQQLLADFARRGCCPPPLFTAFWAARFNIKRFYTENTAALSQHAIMTFFHEIHDDTVGTIGDTMIQLLEEAQCEFTGSQVRRWLNQRPVTPLHQEWLTMCRDYTLYLNLHVQMRGGWYSRDHIYSDVSALWARTLSSMPVSRRIQSLRTPSVPNLHIGLLGLPLVLQPPPVDISGGVIHSLDVLAELLHQSLFRL